MYLSKLEIFGFKSFANKITLKFDEGLTGIIGPNGCGKSNVVDAIRWVLGEQRPSVLRCDRMENVIFNGTATRKPLNFAEVSMYIENNRNVLPSEYTELKLTRRLHRSGESEYLINNQTVRLMDIVNLFADTGMGADAYSVIELKMVEQILSDNALERRRLFEEAAGIKKYKARRKSALNKLDTTQQELTRVDDILAEVQKNVNSLSRQVGKARRYHELKAALRDNELLLSYLKIMNYTSELKPLENELTEISRSKEALGTEVHQMEAQLEGMRSELVRLEQEYRRKAAVFHQFIDDIREQQNLKQLRQQRVESLTESIENFNREIEREQAKAEHLAAEAEQKRRQILDLQKEMAAAQKTYRRAANEQLMVENRLSEEREKYQQYVQENLRELQKGSEIREAFQKIRLEKENVTARLEKATDALARIRSDQQQRQDTIDRLEKEIAEVREELEMYQQEQSHLEKRLQALRDERENLRNNIADLQGKLEKVRNRKDFLENLIKNYEGFSQSVQYVMSKKAEYRGVVDTLANLVDCPEEYRPALESYLAEIANYLVVEAVDTAQEILQTLRKQDKGRLSVVPLPLLNGKPSSPLTLPKNDDNTTPLLSVVQFPPSYAPLFEHLFRTVFLVTDLPTAIELHRQYPDATFVTREGDILEHWGNITGGAAGKRMGLIGRKEQFQKVSEEFEQLSHMLETQKSRLEAINDEYREREAKLAEFVQLQRSTHQQLVELEKQLNRQSYETERLGDSDSDLTAEIATLNERLSELQTEEARLKPQIDALDQRAEAYRRKEQEMQTALREIEAEVKAVTEQTQQHQIAIISLTAKEKELNQQVEFINRNIENTEQFIAERHERIRQSQATIADLQNELEAIEAKLVTLFRNRDEAETAKNQTEQRYQEHKAGIDALENELKKKQRLWNQARERVQELELKIREYQVKLSSIKEHIAEAYGEAALTFDPKSLDPSRSVTQVQEEIEDIRRKIERLGDVNPLAIKEYEKEKERLDFLTAQRDDLLDARDKLLETIEKLNTTARKQFLEVFEKIQRNFQRVFQEFFNGGTAELVLVESRDPLEANIDIIITHKGKQLKTLTLLSAGEKTLTAISLLFAIYLVKPSPFCILDEVDAPLDDVNISRLTKALSLFAKDTQFILVTHNKKTMEAAKMLYGVTMEEVGVSKIVSVKFD
jgi:chromosome segregation protein